MVVGVAGLTSAVLDFRGRRLVTGATDGSVRLWNFNNGDLLKVLPPLCVEVSCLATQVGETVLATCVWGSGCRAAPVR